MPRYKIGDRRDRLARELGDMLGGMVQAWYRGDASEFKAGFKAMSRWVGKHGFGEPSAGKMSQDVTD
jgi:hypothetical protein